MKKKLFIIGNGFDRAHNMNTLYKHFRQYLRDTYLSHNGVLKVLNYVPFVSLGAKGEDIFDVEDVAQFLEYLISQVEPKGHDWSDVETSLGNLDYGEVFDLLPEQYDVDGDEDYWAIAYNNEAMAYNLRDIVVYIKMFFEEWIDEIELNKDSKKQSFENLLDGKTMFLTFNYTETLEEIYQVPRENICHIHGKQGEEIYFGHGDSRDYTEEYMSKYIGSENALTELDGLLKKDTEQALKKSKKFFDKIDGTIDEIYSIGFSYSDVDLVYIKEICSRISDNVIWYINDFDPEKTIEYIEKIRECGFDGMVRSFNLMD